MALRAGALMRATAILTIVGALAGAETAVAAPTWLPPVMVAGPQGSFSEAHVAMNFAGDALVGWQSQSAPFGIPQVLSRRAGSRSWVGPVSLAEGASSPSFALDDVGNSLVLFGKGYAQASFRSGATGDWQDPITISEPSLFGGLRVAFDGVGNAIAVWAVYRGSRLLIQVDRRDGASGSWRQPATTLSEDAWGGRPALAVDRAGDAVAAWTQRHDADTHVVQASFASAQAAAWSPPIDLSVPIGGRFTTLGGPKVAFDAVGNATAVWAMGNLGRADIYSAHRPVAAGWGSPVRIAVAGNTTDVELAVAPDGTAIVAWVLDADGRTLVQSIARRPAQPWGSPVSLSPVSRYATGVSLAVSRTGNALATWIERPTEFASPDTLRASLRPGASGAWEPAADVATSSTRAYRSDIAMDGAGNALGAWNPDFHSVEVVELDGRGPLLTKLATLQTGASRALVRFAVTPVPWASRLAGSPIWRFGDGTSATGVRVTHAYRDVGKYTVTLSQSDATGSTSTASLPIAIDGASGRPSLRGRARVGATLRCLHEIVRGTTPIRYLYGWLRNGSTIRGATQPFYRPRLRDAGALVACRVTASNAAGSIPAVSQALRIER